MRYIDWDLVNVGVFFVALVMLVIGIFTDGNVRLVCGASYILLELVGWIMMIIRRFKR